MKKDYIESVTNLRRTTKKYVPMTLFEETVGKLIEFGNIDITANIFNDDCDESTKYVGEVITELRSKAKEQEIELYTNDVKQATLERPIDICPYCGKQMWPRVADEPQRYGRYRGFNPLSSVVFECPTCGCKSPSALYNDRMLDRNEVKTAIEYIVNHCGEDEEEEDEE